MLKVLWIFLLQNHGFGCNYNRFGKDCYLDAISRESNIRSEFVFCATNTQIWDGYSRVEDTKDMLLNLYVSSNDIRSANLRPIRFYDR